MDLKDIKKFITGNRSPSYYPRELERGIMKKTKYWTDPFSGSVYKIKKVEQSKEEQCTSDCLHSVYCKKDKLPQPKTEDSPTLGDKKNISPKIGESGLKTEDTGECKICGSTAIDHTEAMCNFNVQMNNNKPKPSAPLNKDWNRREFEAKLSEWYKFEDGNLYIDGIKAGDYVEREIESARASERKRIIEKIDIEIRKISGQWEGKPIEYIEGNQKAFANILELLSKLKKDS